MASGDTLFIANALSNEPPAAAFMTFDTRNAHPVLDADDTTSEIMILSGVLPNNYAGGGISIKTHWAATSATSGTAVLATSIERLGEVQDMDSDSFATANNGTTVTVGTTGVLNITSIDHSNGAEMDSVAVGEGFRLKVARLPADGEDSMVGDAEVRFVEIVEQ